MSKSPFYVVEEFISPLLCEDIVDYVYFTVPDVDKEGFPVKTIKTNEKAEQIIYERLLTILPDLQSHYNFQYKGTESIRFEWFPEQCITQELNCENSSYINKKWVRTKVRDFTGILFMSDFQESIPFDNDFEVYGGKLEFPQHRFGFNPQRGTLVIFPSDPHFINSTAKVIVGDLFQARIQIAAKTAYIYNPKLFPGNFLTWFQPFLQQA